MVTKKIIYSVLICILMSSCGLFNGDFPYDKKALTYKNKFVYDGQFQSNGIYVYKRYQDKGIYYFMYLFKNGTYFEAGKENFEEKNLSDCLSITSHERDIPYSWGYFIIEDDILKVQTYDPSSLSRYTEYKVKEKWAEIVDDSTIHFFKDINPEGKSSNLDQTFHFRYCENKPDSTNILMRN